MAEIKSVPTFKCISPKQLIMYISDKTNDYSIYLSIPRVKKPIPLLVVFRALNIISDKDICKKIVLDIDNPVNKKILYRLSGSIVDGYDIKSYNDAIQYITSNVMFTPINMDKESGQQKKREFAIDVVENDLFPHCRSKNEKIYFLGYMANKLIKASLGWSKLDDRDDYKNKAH